jgi:hypothetical protein
MMRTRNQPESRRRWWSSATRVVRRLTRRLRRTSTPVLLLYFHAPRVAAAGEAQSVRPLSTKGSP